MTPAKRITDPAFKYTSSANTDIRKLFAKVRRLQREAQPKATVAQIKTRRSA